MTVTIAVLGEALVDGCEATSAGRDRSLDALAHQRRAGRVRGLQ